MFLNSKSFRTELHNITIGALIGLLAMKKPFFIASIEVVLCWDFFDTSHLERLVPTRNFNYFNDWSHIIPFLCSVYNWNVLHCVLYWRI